MSEAGYVLIVDDSEGIRDALARDLRRLGHRCDTAANGRMGLEKLRESDFDVALIDLKMPEMGGLGLLRAMEEAGLTTVPVVLSGQAQIPEAVEATRRGAFDFIEKPADAETIRRTVGRALRHRRALCNARRMAGLAEQWEATFDAFPDMIVVLQPDCRIQQVNQ
ncbi:MAG: response regulator, partial [Phycisphaerae bacterium]